MTAAWHLEHPERSQHPCASGWAASLAWHSSSLGGWGSQQCCGAATSQPAIRACLVYCQRNQPQAFGSQCSSSICSLKPSHTGCSTLCQYWATGEPV